MNGASGYRPCRGLPNQWSVEISPASVMRKSNPVKPESNDEEKGVASVPYRVPSLPWVRVITRVGGEPRFPQVDVRLAMFATVPSTVARKIAPPLSLPHVVAT